MKKLFLIMMFSAVSVFAQYPNVSIMDVQFLPDSIISLGDAPSPLNGDTVTVTGVVMVRPVVDSQEDRRRIIAAGARWSLYMQDQSGALWGGINLIQHDTTGSNQNTFLDLVDTAQVIQVTGVIEEYFTSTQMSVLLDPIQPVLVIDQLAKRPDPIKLEMTEFMSGGVLIPEAEKYEDMYIQIDNVFTSDRNTASGTFRINDGNGNSMSMYDQSGYFTLRGHRLTGKTDYDPPVDGATITSIRGILHTRTDGYYIVPLYPGDIVLGSTPPIISSIDRNKVLVGPNEEVEISAKIVDLDGTVSGAKLFYRVNEGPSTGIELTPPAAGDSLYTGTIPAVALDSAVVDYYIWAQDDISQISTNPVDTTRNRYFYSVLNRDLTIQDVQYSPYGSGYSAYNGMEITVTGIVTADTSDFPSRVYIQNGEGAWSGIRIFGTETSALKRGDEVSVTGLVYEDFGVTRLGTLDQGVTVSVLSSGNAVPAATVVPTGTIDGNPSGFVDAEKYESVLVTYENVTVENYTADGGSNFGEILVNDGSGATRVELEDGTHNYGNGSQPSLYIVNTDATFDAITGVMYYSYGNFKLNPRKDDDFLGFLSDVEDEVIPSKFELSNNYPNPFNPSTQIRVSLPFASNITLRVYDVLGRQVAELLNGYRNAGSFNVNFNASKLSSGIYFYKLEAGSFVDIKKMMLIK